MVFGKKKLEKKDDKSSTVDLSPKAEVNQALEHLTTIIQYLAAIHQKQEEIYSGMEEIYGKLDSLGGKKR